MPGFNPPGSVQMDGINGPSGVAETRRKHRWIFTLLGGEKSDVSTYLATAQRPHAVIEEAEMHHDEEKDYFAGRYYWEPITLVFYDVQSPVDASAYIYDWLQRCIDIQNVTVSLPSDYKKDTTMSMTDGSGQPTEFWRLYHSWPKEVNWNDLDYGANEIATIDVTLRYQRAVKEI